MYYIRFTYLNPEKYLNEPITTYSEFNSKKVQTRELSLYKGGQMGYAVNDIEYNGAFLTKRWCNISTKEALEAIGVVIEPMTKEEFEIIWNKKVTFLKKLMGILFFRV
ncbi:hypothetical protein HPT25_05650 [Bacillus sp. BRMEA1]|uniref:DUF6881 domain-containing protein n=1 Tax=Neobacillus endophyticus TaxID=2738405 RepID=UPI0015635D18|nr:hypothetical protein [Neobacillus endophyticus]NRD76978.1 hypothetical protein [Neobacillus endophyticus]